MSQEKWFVLKRNATLHHVVPISKSIVVNLYNLLGVGFKKHICIFKQNEQMSWHYQISGINSVAKFVLQKTFVEKNFNEKIYKNWKIYANKLEKIFKQIEIINLQKTSRQQLFNLYKNLISNLELESAFGTLSDFLSSELIPQKIVKYLTKLNIPKKEFTEIIGIATTSIYKSPYQQEQENLLEIAIEKSKNKDISKKIINHNKKYWYVQNDYQSSIKLNNDYFQKQINQIIKKDPTEEYNIFKLKSDKIIKKKQELIILAKNKKETNFLKILKMIDIHVLLWDLKKAMMQKAFYYLDEILKEISKRHNLAFSNIKWLTPDEINLVTQNKLKGSINEEIVKRKKLCVLEVGHKKGIKIMSGQKAERIVNEVENIPLGKTNKIKGQIGNLGQARGIVKVILNPHDKKEFKQGEILVTGMTTPDFIPFMKNASAIITDEGGITCHAAIVSRELNLPCIIGTKIATKILKDGDLVEVDANNGIIKILKSTKNPG